MSFENEICPYCGAEYMWHDYEHEATTCFPQRIDKLEIKVSLMTKALEYYADPTLSIKDGDFGEIARITLANVTAEK